MGVGQDWQAAVRSRAMGILQLELGEPQLSRARAKRGGKASSEL